MTNGLFGSSVGALLGQPSIIPNQISLGRVLPIVLGPIRRLFPNLDFGMVTRPVPVYYGGTVLVSHILRPTAYKTLAGTPTVAMFSLTSQVQKTCEVW